MMTVRAFWKWLIESRGDIEVSRSSRKVLRMRPKVMPQVNPKPVADSTWLALWHSKLIREDRALLGLGYFCGFRRIELCSIAPNEVLVETGLLDFIRKGHEGTRHELPYQEIIELHLRPHLPHVGPFDEWLGDLAWLATQRKGETFLNPDIIGAEVEIDRHESRMWPTESDMIRFNKRLWKLCRQAGLPERSVHPHALRHSAATNLYRAGVEALRIKFLMNHATLETTAGYAKVSGEFTSYREQHMHDSPVEEDDDDE